MSYTKQNFNDGEILTASQLNNIENGIIKVEEDLNITLTDELDTIETRLEEIEDSIPSVNKYLSYSSNDAVANRIITNALDRKQSKLPVNTSGTSSRVWVTTNNHYKVNSIDGGPTLTKCGRQIGVVEFTSDVTLEEIDSYTVDGYTYKEYSPKIVSEFTLQDNTGTVSTAMKASAILARVAELYIMTSDDGETPFAYKDYIRATGNGTNKITFYWTYPYYFRRVMAASAGQDSTNAKSGGPKVGIVTVTNYFSKWNAGDINSNCTLSKTDYRDYLLSRYVKDIVERTDFTEVGDESRYTNYNLFHKLNEEDGTYAINNPDNNFYFSLLNTQDNEEPFGETIAVRDASGHLVVEASSYDFHAVNNKQLEEQIDLKLNEFYNNKIRKLNNINPFVSYKIYRNELGITDVTGRDQSDKKDMTGWYRIAVGPGNNLCSNMFHVNVHINRPGYMGGVYFIVDQMYFDTTPTIKLIDYSTRKNAADVIDKIRVVYNPSNGFLSYVDIHINKSSSGTCDGWGGSSGTKVMYEISVETLFNQVGSNFVLTDPPEIPEGGVESTLVTDELPSGYSQVVINTTT